MKLNKTSIFYSTLILTSANFFVRVLGFIYRIFLSRTIGPQGMGLYQLIFPVYMITITITSSGIPLAVSRIIAQRNAINDESGVRRTVIVAIYFVALLAMLLSAIIILNVDVIANNILHEPRTRTPLLIFSPCILITGIGAVFKGYFYGTKNVRPSALSEIIEQLVRIILVVIILLKISSFNEQIAASVVILGMVIGELSSALYLHHRYTKATRKYYSQSNKTLSTFCLSNQMLAIAIPVTLTRLASSFINSANSILIPQRLMASGLSNHEAIGLFGIVSGMVIPLLFLPFTLISALSVVVIPNLSEDKMLNNWHSIRDKISKSIFITSLTAFTSMGLLIPLGFPIGIILYQQPSVGKYLMLLAPSMIFLCLQHHLSSILNGLGKQNRAAIHFMLGGIIQIFCTYFLVANPNYGIYGFGFGFFISSIIVSTLNLIIVIQTTGLHFEWIEWIIKPATASLLMGLTIRLFYSAFITCNMPSFFSLIFSAMIGLVILFSVLFALGSLPWIVKTIKMNKIIQFK